MSEDLQAEQQAVQRMLARERLGIDVFEKGRTTFLSHLGAWDTLVPGPWIANRELIYSLALANLSPQKRSALAKSVVVDHGREFGVGRLVLQSHPSGLPFGGSSLFLKPRGDEGPACYYTWALGDGGKREGAHARECDWLLLRAQPEWALEEAPRSVSARGLETLVGIGGEVLICVPSAVAARQIADLVRGRLPWHAHPRFGPHLVDDDAQPFEAAVARADPSSVSLHLWPHDRLNSPKIAKREITSVVLVGASEAQKVRAMRWAAGRKRCEVVEAGCPGRFDRAALLNFWRACGTPRVLLRGDSRWANEGAAWLGQVGAPVARQTKGTQLGLF